MSRQAHALVRCAKPTLILAHLQGSCACCHPGCGSLTWPAGGPSLPMGRVAGSRPPLLHRSRPPAWCTGQGTGRGVGQTHAAAWPTAAAAPQACPPVAAAAAAAAGHGLLVSHLRCLALTPPGCQCVACSQPEAGWAVPLGHQVCHCWLRTPPLEPAVAQGLPAAALLGPAGQWPLLPAALLRAAVPQGGLPLPAAQLRPARCAAGWRLKPTVPWLAAAPLLWALTRASG